MTPTDTLDTELTTHQAGTKYMWIEDKLGNFIQRRDQNIPK